MALASSGSLRSLLLLGGPIGSMAVPSVGEQLPAPHLDRGIFRKLAVSCPLHGLFPHRIEWSPKLSISPKHKDGFLKLQSSSQLSTGNWAETPKLISKTPIKDGNSCHYWAGLHLSQWPNREVLHSPLLIFCILSIVHLFWNFVYFSPIICVFLSKDEFCLAEIGDKYSQVF